MGTFFPMQLNLCKANLALTKLCNIIDVPDEVLWAKMSTSRLMPNWDYWIITSPLVIC